MIPDIGIIVGLYAVVRLCDILMSAETRYASNTAMWITKTAATLGIVVIAYLTVDVLMTASTGQSPFGVELNRPPVFQVPPPRPER
jgi:cytochrome b561